MRIRKRTPARAASPGPSPAPPTAPLPLPLQQPKQEVLHEEEEKRVILVGAGDRQDDRVTAASKNSAMDDVPKPEPGPQHATGAGGRCSRNDGKRWRCKNAVVPGYLFCDRHVAWSTRKRKPRVTKKTKDHGGGVLDPATEELAKQEDAKDEAARTIHLGCDGGDVFYYYGGFQPGCRKRERGGGPGPAAA